MNRLRLCLLLPLIALAGCGGSDHANQGVSAPQKAVGPSVCPGATDPAQVARGGGQMGGCEPGYIKAGALKRGATLAPSGERFPDISNNNGLTDSQTSRIGALNPLVYLKTNQGTGFIDRTFLHRTALLRRAGAATGGYDFVSCYCAAEANLFVSLLHQAGMTRTSKGWGPPTLDVEYGNASRQGVAVMAAIVQRAFGRVQVYTGCWYWCGRLGGGYWPVGAYGWLAGYPSAPILPGLPRRLYVAHQYTDRGFNGVTSSDMSIYLAGAGHPTFAAYVAAATKPKPVSKHTRLLHLYQRRASLRKTLAAHGCRTLRHSSRRCKVWFAHGDAVNASIKVLHKQHVY